MLKTTLTIVFSLLLFFSAAFVQNVSAQTDDDDGYYSTEALRSDYKQVDVVAYVDVKEVISVGSSDKNTDCVKFTGNGYCSFLLRAEIKELYKGRIKTKTIEFYTGGEVQLIKSNDRYLGELLVFLEKFNDRKKTKLQTMENSIRGIENGVIEKMKKIAKKKN